MFRLIAMISVLASGLVSGIAAAQAPASAPAGSTGQCRDGSYWTGATKKGACHGHKGVQDWYAAAGAPAAAAPSSPAANSAPATHASSTAPAASTAAPASSAAPVASKETSKPTTAQAAGAAPGLVWLNTKSNVYHCSTDRYYGKTKSGAYMSEADAIAKGARADHGKPCK